MKKQAIAIALVFAAAHAQKFEVASVKPHADMGGAEQIKAGPAGVTMTRVGLGTAIRWAYGLQPRQLDGPEWLGERMVDIVAKAAAPAPEAQLRLMMQSLLTDRLHLAKHWTEKPTKLDVMRVPTEARKNFTPSSSLSLHLPNTNGTGIPSGTGKWTGVEFSYLAEQCSLGFTYGNPTIDATEMPGRWDFDLTFTPPKEPDPGPDAHEALFLRLADYALALKHALIQQLGVSITREVFPIKTLVIDHVDMSPTQN